MVQDIYVVHDGELSADENTFRFSSKSDFRRFPVENTRSINFYSGGKVTTGAINLANKKNVALHFFGYYGNYIGSYWPVEKYFSGDLSVKQSELYLNSDRRLELCVLLVKGMIQNMGALLRRYEIDDEVFATVPPIGSIGELMLFEARARRKYYTLLDQILPDPFKIGQRIRRPPSNSGNAMISFGNSRLYADVVSECRMVSLNPTISFYHSPTSSRYSLSLDVSEIFKPSFVDRFLIRLVRQGFITDKDFISGTEEAFLNNAGREKFLKEWNHWMDYSVWKRDLSRKVSRRELIRIELFKLIKHFYNVKAYEPYSLEKGKI